MKIVLLLSFVFLVVIIRASGVILTEMLRFGILFSVDIRKKNTVSFLSLSMMLGYGFFVDALYQRKFPFISSFAERF